MGWEKVEVKDKGDEAAVKQNLLDPRGPSAKTKRLPLISPVGLLQWYQCGAQPFVLTAASPSRCGR